MAMDKDEILKALAHPKRIEMLGWMKSRKRIFPPSIIRWTWGSAPASSNAAACRNRPVSGHLSILQRADLVTTKRVGQWIFYKRNEDTIAAFLTDIGKTL